MATSLFQGRLKPYTERGIARIPCSRCGAASDRQWQVCANGNRYLGVCRRCDVEVNRLVLDFFRVPEREKLLERYRQEA